MASIDSCFARSMNAHVLTTITSASSAAAVISCPACCAKPSMTSPSTRFFGQPKETKPIFIGDCRLQIADSRIVNLRVTIGATRQSSMRSRIHPVEHPGIRDRLAQMLEPADPAHHPFDAHAEPAVRDGAIPTQVEIPLEGFLRQVVLLDSRQPQIQIRDAFAAADDFAVALRGKDVD